MVMVLGFAKPKILNCFATNCSGVAAQQGRRSLFLLNLMNSNTQTVRVLHVVDSLAPGGMENGVVNISQRLQGNGFDFHVACLRHKGDFSKRMAKPEQVVVMGKTSGFSLQTVLNLSRHIRAIQPDLVHSHNLGALIYAALATFGGIKPPVVHGEHGQLGASDTASKRLWQRRILFAFCRRVHVVSAGLRDHLHQWGLRSWHPIVATTNGVDTTRFAPEGEGERDRTRKELGFDGTDQVVGIVGRLVAVKRHHMLLEAFTELADEFPRLHLLVVGDGGDGREGVITAMREHPLAARVHWVGHQDNLPRFYQAMDLLTAPSELEGLSNAVLEAMATGLPVLGHVACGNAELIQHGQNGLLSPLNSPRELAAAMRAALNDHSTLRKLGQAARESVLRDYSMEAMVSGYRRLYRSALALD
jgi:glycosyltransferase involved in cell wall biosynthesis